jgi:hypothetical protein
MSDSGLGKEEIERTRLAFQTAGTIKGAARLLGIAHRTMQHRMKYVREDKPKFTAPELPSSLPSIEELLEQRTAQGDRSIASDEARHLIPIQIHIDGPYGLWVWGDPHVDADGCNMRLLREHVELARHPYIVSGHIGDIANFWVGRLARLYAHQSTSVHEAIMLAEWLLTQHEQLFVVLGNHDCLDMQTEALTKRGWKKFDEIHDDDFVMSFVVETGGWEWSPILGKIDRNQNGKFIEIKGFPVDMRVTPNHRILHRKRNYKGLFNSYGYCEAGKMPMRFEIPVSAKNNNKEYDISDEWIILAGWLLTDGSIHYGQGKYPRVSFYQSKECKSLEKALKVLGLHYTLNIRERNITSICGRQLVKKPLPHKEYHLNAEATRKVLEIIPRKKELPEWAFKLSTRQFEVLLNAIIEGDGVWDGSRPEDKKCGVVHGEINLLESLQICAIQNGWRAHISLAREKDYRLNLARKPNWQAERTNSVIETEGNERVWCLTVPRTNFMVRRNGKPYFTGNCWSGSGLENPLNWILKHAQGVTEEHGVRLALKSPNGVVTRVNARHDFPGRSQYNINHGMRRELAFGHRDHILVSGHLHSGGDQGLCHDGDGMVSQLVRVSGYKQVDHYAKQLNFPPQKIHPSALIIVDPREPETSRGRVWCAPTVEMGVKLLNAIRADYEASKEASNAVKRQPNSSVDKKRITRKSSR